MRHCTNCGHVLNDKAAFCSICGKEQKKIADTEADVNDMNDGLKDKEINYKKTQAADKTKDDKQSLNSVARGYTLLKARFMQWFLPLRNTKRSLSCWRQGLLLKKSTLFFLVIILLMASCVTYVHVSESHEINKYKEANDVSALAHIVRNDASDSKRKKAIEALVTIDRPEALQTVEDLLCSSPLPNTERMIFEVLIKSKIELPDSIAILSKSGRLDTTLTWKYFEAIESYDKTLRKMKNLICRLTSIEKGYENIENVLKNGVKIIESANEADKKMFSEVSLQNASWKNEIQEREKLDNELNKLGQDKSLSESIVNENLEQMHEFVMVGYYIKNNIAYQSIYSDENTRSLINKAMKDLNHTVKMTVDYTANGDVKKKAQIYVSIARSMGPNILYKVSPLGLQVVSEADKLNGYQKEIKKIKNDLNAWSHKYSVKFEIVDTVLNNIASEQRGESDNYVPVTISEKTYSDEISSIRYPQIKIDKNADVQDIINLRIQNLVNKHIYLGSQIPKYYYNGSGKGYIKTYYKIHLNDGKLLSLTFDDYTYFGGAHDRRTRIGLTFDIKTGKLIEWTDLFLPISETNRELANKYMANQVENKKLMVDKPFPGIRVGVLVPSVFCMSERRNPVIIFQPYEVGPFSSGIIELEVDKKCFENKQI